MKGEEKCFGCANREAREAEKKALIRKTDSHQFTASVTPSL